MRVKQYETSLKINLARYERDVLQQEANKYGLSMGGLIRMWIHKIPEFAPTSSPNKTVCSNNDTH